MFTLRNRSSKKITDSMANWKRYRRMHSRWGAIAIANPHAHVFDPQHTSPTHAA